MTTKSSSADDLAHALEAVILRRLREKRIDGYTLEMSHELAALAANSHHAMKEALEAAYETLAHAFSRIHCLPRTTDTELATRIGNERAKIEKLLSRLTKEI